MLFRWADGATWRRFVPLAYAADLDGIAEALEDYDAFAVYHGCRPIDPMTYYRDGLRLSDVTLLNQRAEEIFLTPEFPNLTREEFNAATSRLPCSYNRKLYVALDGDEFLRGSAHYLIYGSEHLLRLANSFKSRGMPNRKVLKRFGTPTLFEIHVPRSKVPTNHLRALPQQLLNACECANSEERPPLGICFQFESPLCGSWIYDHQHPEQLRDPFEYNAVYRYKDAPK